MVQLGRTLVVGGGIAGISAALCMRRLGAEVDLIERDNHWGALGAGLTLTGPSLRALDALGLLNEIRQEGFIGPGTEFHGADGAVVGELPEPESPDALHLSGGILRTALHRVMAKALSASGVNLRLGTEVRSLDNTGDRVRVTSTDRAPQLYDMVLGADGINSQVRQLVFPEVAKPKRTGQGCWRLLARRPSEVVKPVIVLGGEYTVGFTLLSPESMYMFLLEPVTDGSRIAPAEYAARLGSLMQGYGGLVETARSELRADSEINYRPLEAILVPTPWYRGRVLLMGDAAHATTPHLATGAGLAIEDALVLMEEIGKASTVEAGLVSHMARRFERCATVVENSVEIGNCQLSRDAPEMMFGLMQSTAARLLEPY